MNVFDDVKYVLLDAVPGSLIYSYNYLMRQLGDKRVGFYYNNDEFDLNKFDIYIMPSWHFKEINKYLYDVSINVSSMQEMGQQHVDFYFSLFNDVTRINGLIYLTNSHDYVFKGKWNYDEMWRRNFISNTISSWTRFYPTEVFVKTQSKQININQIQLAAYEYNLEKQDCLEDEISKRQAELENLQLNNNMLREELAETKKILKNVKAELDMLNDSLESRCIDWYHTNTLPGKIKSKIMKIGLAYKE